MAAVEDELDVAHCKRLCAAMRNIDGELLADEAARILDALLAVERIADWQRMNDRPLGPDTALIHGAKNALNVSDFNLLGAEVHRRRERLRAEPTGGDVDDHRLDCEPGRPLGHADDCADRLLRLVEIGDHTTLDAARCAITEADDLGGMSPALERLALRPWREARDDAADLGRADVEH